MSTISKRESAEVEDAYIIIAEFFSAYDLRGSLTVLKKALAAAAGRSYHKGTPANLLYFFENLEQLIKAAITICKTAGERELAILAIEEGAAPNITGYNLYCGWHYKPGPWYFFPRHLSAKEYANPYKVFKRMAGHRSKKEWEHLVKELCFYTLSNSPLSEWLEKENAFSLYLLLAKFIEAAHLVEVRAINEIAGEPRPKWKGLSSSPSETENNFPSKHAI